MIAGALPEVEPLRLPRPGSVTPRRLLFLGEAVSLAHVARPAVLARWAGEAGHEVHFACGAARADVARGEGLDPIPIPTVAADDFFGRIARIEFMYRVEELEEYVRAEADLIAHLEPDVVVSDFRLSAAISCSLTRTPLLSLANAYWSPGARCRFLPPRGGPFRHLPLWARKALISTLRPLAFRYLWGRPVNQARRRFGLTPQRDFRLHYTAGAWCAYLDLPEFVPLDWLPPGHFFLGPVPWEPQSPAGLDALGTRQPLVYASLAHADEETLGRVLQAVTGLGFKLVLSGVAVKRALALRIRHPQLADRWRAHPCLAAREVLERAVATVCHGGSGTVYQSLAAGVPVLCVPTNGDQGLVADRTVAHGVGIRLEPEQCTRANLEAALRDLIDTGEPASRACQFAHWMGRHDTRQNWLEFLAAVVRNRAQGWGRRSGMRHATA